MKLCVKVVIATQQRHATAWASALTAGARPNMVLLKFMTSKDHQVVLRRHKGLVRTKLGLDEDLTPMQQARKSELWPLFKEAKAASKWAF
jgi:hypothetical protein